MRKSMMPNVSPDVEFEDGEERIEVYLDPLHFEIELGVYTENPKRVDVCVFNLEGLHKSSYLDRERCASLIARLVDEHRQILTEKFFDVLDVQTTKAIEARDDISKQIYKMDNYRYRLESKKVI